MKKYFHLTGGVLLIFLTFLSCEKEYSCEMCWRENLPPVADAGIDTSVSIPPGVITLNSSGSFDPDGEIISRHWYLVSGPSMAFINNPQEIQTEVAFTVPGPYIFSLLVTDFYGATAVDTIKISVNNTPPQNLPPVANAGADLQIRLPVNSVILNGSNSYDPNNNISGYEWSYVSGPSSYSISDPPHSQTQVTSLVEGVYTFKLKVSDVPGLFDEDSVIVTVDPLLPPPSGNSNVYFFFRDPTGSLDGEGINVIERFYNPIINLVRVKVGDFWQADIGGVWSLGTTPFCPIDRNYVDMTAFGSFINLPAGTYTWSAESLTSNLNGYPAPAGFVNYWSTPHSASGVLTVLPNADCTIKEIVF